MSYDITDSFDTHFAGTLLSNQVHRSIGITFLPFRCAGAAEVERLADKLWGACLALPAVVAWRAGIAGDQPVAVQIAGR